MTVPSDEDLTAIVEINDLFESDLISCVEVRIENLLDRVSKGARANLFEQLLSLEVEYRIKLGQPIGASDFVKRFPEYKHIVDKVARKTAVMEIVAPVGSDRLSASNQSQAIGPYQLVKRIGEGGMGEVWLADQTEPVRRKVAIKLIKGGKDHSQVIARFEAERQALAMMDHPCIASVYDAGESDDGMPYFVMELVKGVPLTQYCDEHTLSIQARMELFVPICEAIQHAHQKGIIHRDLKPSNILVGEVDGVPVPKVIDFGLAKATEPQTHLTDKTLFTEFGQIVGTVLYMSPEQADMKADGIDTRTDIYSLGVILYELLTGTTPVPKSMLKTEAMMRVLEVIRESDPPRPSIQLSDSSDTISEVSAKRQIDAKRLGQILKGDLDWIVMKTLEKDRDRRYESAAALASEIRRFLGGEPVEARPPSKLYLASKFVRRNRLLVGSALATTFLLIAGIGGTSWFAVQSSKEANRANAETKRANSEALIAKQQSQLTFQALTSVTNEISDALKNLPNSGEIRRKLVSTIIEKLDDVATQYIDDAKMDLATIDLLMNLATNICEFDTEDKETVESARKIYVKANGLAEQLAKEQPNDVATLKRLNLSRNHLFRIAGAQKDQEATIKFEQLGFEAAERLLELDITADESKEIMANAFLCRAIRLLYSEGDESSLSFFEKSVALREKLVEDQTGNSGHQKNLESAKVALANAYKKTARLDQALVIYKDIEHSMGIRVGANPFDFPLQVQHVEAMQKIANALLALGRYDDATTKYSECLLRAEGLQKQDPTSIVAKRVLADTLVQTSQLNFQLENYEEAVLMSQRTEELLGGAEQDPVLSGHLAGALVIAGKAHFAMGNIVDGENEFRRAGKINQLASSTIRGSRFTPMHLAQIASDQGEMFKKSGQFDRAEEAFLIAMRHYQLATKPDTTNSLMAWASNALGEIYDRKQETESAIKWFSLGCEIWQRRVDKSPSNMQDRHELSYSRLRLGQLHAASGRPSEAEMHFREAIKMNPSSDPSHIDPLVDDFEKLAETLLSSARLHFAQDDRQKTVQRLREIVVLQKKRANADEGVFWNFVKIAQSVEEYELAVELLRETMPLSSPDSGKGMLAHLCRQLASQKEASGNHDQAETLRAEASALKAK